MKVLVSLILVFALVPGFAVAGCGKKQNDEGTLTALNSGNKTFVVTDKSGKETTFKVTPGTQVKDSDGKAAKLADLVNKQVAVTSEHSQADLVAQL